MSSGRHEEIANSAALREQLRHVYWIGGGSGAGKSTVARRIAARHGLRLYATDDVMADHARRSTSEGAPLLHRFMAMSMDERWVSRHPSTTTDPERALRNLLERDRMFTDALREEAARLNLPVIEVDAALTEDDLAGRVTEVFGLGSADSAHAPVV